MFDMIVTLKIFRAASTFLREISNDNSYCKSLWNDSLDVFVESFTVT